MADSPNTIALEQAAADSVEHPVVVVPATVVVAVEAVPQEQHAHSPHGFWNKVWDLLVRWRTWVVNGILGAVFGVIFTPDLVLALLGFNWSTIIPKEYVPFVSLATIALNVWMRPRPAARSRDFK